MATITLAQLRTQVRDRCDLVSGSDGGFISDTELNSLINASAAELYDIEVATNTDWFVVSMPFTISSGNTTTVTSSFLTLMGVDYLDGSDYREVRRFEWSERNDKDYSYSTLTGPVSDRKYRMVGDTITIIPTDNATGTYRLWYIPEFSNLVSGSHTLNATNNWIEYVVVDAAIKCRDKAEEDTSVLMNQKAALAKRIMAAASHRDSNEPSRARPVAVSSFSGRRWGVRG